MINIQGKKNYTCNICGNSFTRIAHLKTHNDRQHGGSKKFSCNKCDKLFHVKQQLERHERVHTGEKPYSCTVCLKGFARSHHLNKHMKKVHGKDKRKEYNVNDTVVQYDIPSPSQTLVIHTSSLPDQPSPNQVNIGLFILYFEFTPCFLFRIPQPLFTISACRNIFSTVP